MITVTYSGNNFSIDDNLARALKLDRNGGCYEAKSLLGFIVLANVADADITRAYVDGTGYLNKDVQLMIMTNRLRKSSFSKGDY